MIQELRHIFQYGREVYVASKSYKKQFAENRDRNIRFYNWWDEPYEQLWLYRFVKHRNIVPADKVLNFVSVFGKKGVAKLITDGPIVFFSGENLRSIDSCEYTDYLLSHNTAKLALGFDMFEDARYLRFPLWIPFLFFPEADEKAIRTRCAEMRYPMIGERNKFAALVARFDWNGTRSQMYDAIKHIAPIGCPSLVHHNDDELKTKYNDNKIEYLRQFAFNICPENSNSFGYVTEKVFEAIAAGCIPIYWGSYNMPEPDILNQDAIIKWNMNGDNSANIALIEDLYAHPDRLHEFMAQPRLKPEAEEKIIHTIQQLEQGLRNIV